MMKHFLMIATAAAMLSACGGTVQNTSGAAYLARSKAPVAASETRTIYHKDGDGGLTERKVEILSTDQLVRNAAAVEPLLELPARIGLARIENGRLTIIPDDEAVVWAGTAARFPGLGTAIPVDPFLTEYTARTILPQNQNRLRSDANDIITKIRLGAARQHLDAVLIYEIGNSGRGDNAIAGLGPIRTLGGAQLRGAAVKTTGIARAILLDVRNGYPYASISASADLKGAKPDFWEGDVDRKAYAEATRRIMTSLSNEVALVFDQVVRSAATRVASK